MLIKGKQMLLLAISGLIACNLSHLEAAYSSERYSSNSNSTPQQESATKASSPAAYEGTRLLESGENEEAIKKFEEALLIEPNDPAVLGNYAIALRNIGQFHKALLNLQKAILLEPNRRSTWVNLGNCYECLGNRNAALDSFRKALELEPSTDNIHKQIQSKIHSLEYESQNQAGSLGSINSANYLPSILQYGAARWLISGAPLKIYIKDSNEVPYYKPSFEYILKNAFSAWSQASNNQLQFAYSNDPDQSQILCLWIERGKATGSTTELGDTTLSISGHNITRVHMELLTTNTYGRPLTDVEALQADLHEIGHALGLQEHSPNPSDIMYASTVPGVSSLSERDKSTIKAFYGLPYSELLNKEFDTTRAEEAVDQSTNTSKSQVLLNQASEATRNHDYQLALTKLQQAFKLDPTEGHQHALGIAYSNCALGAWRADESAQTEQLFQQALGLLRNCPSYRTDFEGVSKDYQDYKSGKSNEKDSQARSMANEAIAFLSKGNNEEAIKEFKQALLILPDNAEILGDYGVALMNVGQYQNALDNLEKSVALRPHTALLWGHIGRCYMFLHRNKEALESFKKCLQLNPGEPVNSQIKQTIVQLENAIKQPSKKK